MKQLVWPIVSAGQVGVLARAAFDAPTLDEAAAIVGDVKAHGEAALRRHARRFGELDDGEPLVIGPDRMRRELDALEPREREALEQCAEGVRAFARAQRRCVHDLDMPAHADASLRVGHRFVPLDRAGCYAPGGRYPLPSSVLMTAITAREAGVREVVVASPRPTRATIAACALAGADALVPVGGAQAIAALAYGSGATPGCDIVVGPGNRWVTAAKHVVSLDVAIDMLAGPSEIVILSDDSANPVIIAADLLAQAEHDDDARAMLVTTSRALIEDVRIELERQLATLPTATTARAALAGSAGVLCETLDEALSVIEWLAPEHLEVHLCEPALSTARRELSRFGAAFFGSRAGEVLGDYGLGPNHVLPTGGTARHASGLSVFTFLRARTFIEGGASALTSTKVLSNVATLARMEGLEAHARAAELRARADRAGA